jgi:hypothetical protein
MAGQTHAVTRSMTFRVLVDVKNIMNIRAATKNDMMISRFPTEGTIVKITVGTMIIRQILAISIALPMPYSRAVET